MTKVIMRKENGKQIIHFHEKYSKGKRPILIPLVSVSTCRMQTTTGKKKKKKVSYINFKRKYIPHISKFFIHRKCLDLIF